jgi:hypothetical protein
MTIFCCLRFENPQPGGPGHRIYILQAQCGLVIPPGTGFPFRRLLRLEGLRWRYSTPPPHGRLTHSSSSPAYNISARTAQKISFLCRFQLLQRKYACLRNRYSVMAVVYLLILLSLLCNRSTYHNIKLYNVL